MNKITLLDIHMGGGIMHQGYEVKILSITTKAMNFTVFQDFMPIFMHEIEMDVLLTAWCCYLHNLRTS